MFTIEEIGEPGRRLTPEGASGYTFYVIAEGTADVLHRDALVTQLGPGDFFGEMAILGDGRRIADVVATAPMTLYAMFGTSFREMEAELPESPCRSGPPSRLVSPRPEPSGGTALHGSPT